MNLLKCIRMHNLSQGLYSLKTYLLSRFIKCAKMYNELQIIIYTNLYILNNLIFN